MILQTDYKLFDTAPKIDIYRSLPALINKLEATVREFFWFDLWWFFVVLFWFGRVFLGFGGSGGNGFLVVIIVGGNDGRWLMVGGDDFDGRRWVPEMAGSDSGGLTDSQCLM